MSYRWGTVGTGGIATQFAAGLTRVEDAMLQVVGIHVPPGGQAARLRWLRPLVTHATTC